MKIGIVTFHHAKYSYGAVLQAKATAMILKEIGADTELINYENSYEQRGVKTRGKSLKQKAVTVVNYLVRTYFYGGWKNPYRNRKNLDAVYGCVTRKKYSSISQMKDLKYDILVTGSDQVWNPEITDGLDEAFFLNFGTAKKRISYAPSMGSYKLNKKEAVQVKSLLGRYDAISVREKFAADQIQPLIEKPIKVVLDPTLLVDKNLWMKEFPSIKRGFPKPYILTFFVSSGFDSYYSEIESYLKQINLPVWNIQSHERKPHGVSRVICAPSVEMFLRLINNASVVITNSFHATAFSINFKKCFIPILAKGNPARVVNLLESTGLSERINMNPAICMESIDYNSVSQKLEEKRKDSYQWLNNSIQL